MISCTMLCDCEGVSFLPRTVLCITEKSLHIYLSDSLTFCVRKEFNMTISLVSGYVGNDYYIDSVFVKVKQTARMSSLIGVFALHRSDGVCSHALSHLI